MGWWWSSSPRADEQPNTTPSALSTSSLSQDSSSLPPSKPTTSRDEQAQQGDAELREFLAAIEWTGDTTTANSFSKPKHSLVSQPSTSDHPTSTSPSTENNTPPSSISFESLYPDHMSCRSAFDYAFFCQSFGGQWVNVYRYGNLRSCSEHWENFWLCMKARGYSDESRRETIRDHYRKKAVKYKTGPSSEDVWEVRTEPVQNPFAGDIADYEQQTEKIKGEPLAQP
ncbi:hypothetical protein PISL3812_00554 [Talaromyces islandicus]|uniref:Early meiotic induction protein 1 n=1 Tax=Talaromyces islandicus TaxID=28573 RepID=A0A0U1LJL1_TALIS|nr:hypothetical protein PISL3812_00554 [Talaromyces islandicus]